MSDFRPSRALRLGNRMVSPLIRLGLPMGLKRAPMALLTVEGRKSGKPRTTPIALAETDGGWRVVAVYGVCDWSRNLEAAGNGEIVIRGRATRVAARRLPPEEAGPILRDVIAETPAVIRRRTAPYFSADLDSSPEDWERESVHHPVFILSPDPASD